MRKKVSYKTPDELLAEYDQKFPVYEKFTEQLHHLLLQLLATNGYIPAGSEFRPKLRDSVEKTLSKDEKGDINTLDDIMDLAGVRIITHTSNDIKTVAKVLKAEFSESECKFWAKPHDEHRHGANVFGYRASHFYFYFNCARSRLTEWRDFKGIRAEVQVKTFLQHSWSQLSHKLIYKPIEGAAELSEYALASIEREFANVAASIERIDNELDKIVELPAQTLKKQQDLALRIKSSNASDEEISPLAIDLLEKHTETFKNLVDFAGEVGFDTSASKMGDIAKFVEYTGAKGINSIGELLQYIERIPEHKDRLKAICVQVSSRLPHPPAANPLDVIVFLMTFDSENVYKVFQKDYTREIRQAIASVKSSEEKRFGRKTK